MLPSQSMIPVIKYFTDRFVKVMAGVKDLPVGENPKNRSAIKLLLVVFRSSDYVFISPFMCTSERVRAMHPNDLDEFGRCNLDSHRKSEQERLKKYDQYIFHRLYNALVAANNISIYL
jgi:hypothetical protein